MKYRLTSEKAKELLAKDRNLYQDLDGKTLGCLAFHKWDESISLIDLTQANYNLWDLGRRNFQFPLEKDVQEYMDKMWNLGWVVKDVFDDDTDERKEESKVLAPPSEDKINDPKHYTQGVEVIQVIDEHRLGFCLGNVVKYVLRCEHKEDANKDLAKALWYLVHELEKRGGQELITKFCQRWIERGTTMTRIYVGKDAGK